MKISADLLGLLLGLYPVGVLKERWKIKASSKADVISELLKLGQRALLEFCDDNHAQTKLHVFLFEGGWKDFGQPPEPLLKTQPEIRRVVSGSDVSIFAVPTVTVSLFATMTAAVSTAKQVQLKFPWPVKVTVEPDMTIVSFTILAKNAAAYLPDGSVPISKVTRDLDEVDILNEMATVLRPGSQLKPLDLNRGVKALWHKDAIDAMSSKWKSSRSTLTETMDEQYLLKQDRFDAYKDAVKAPLYKTLFKVLSIAQDHPSQFSVNPSEGELMFNRFGKKPDEVENVLREILRAN